MAANSDSLNHLRSSKGYSEVTKLSSAPVIMQKSSENCPGEDQDERENSMEESPMRTIEYLRARLLSERLVTKAAKEKAEELARRVEELEEQLKTVTYQRKRAEKATLEVLSFLANHGIGDISEAYESESDQEESLCESSEGKYDATKEAENVGSLTLNRNDEASGSDHDSSTSSGRPLSWKGRKEITRVSVKRFSDSPIRRRTSYAQLGLSQRHRSGKSCRQIKRRETRSMVEESAHDSAKCDAQDDKTVDSSEILANCLYTRGEALDTSPEKQFERVQQKKEVSLPLLPQVQGCDSSSSIHGHECTGEMERALEHQAQLIGRYEAQEKAQRDWEERYGENNISTPDSCEPGNHSDVTEESDENKAAVPHPIEIVAGHGQEPKDGTEANLLGKDSSFLNLNSFKLAPNAVAGCSQNHKFTETQSSRCLAPDFSFCTVNNYQTEDRLVPPSFHSSAQSSPHFKQSASSISSSFAGSSSFYDSEPPKNLNRHRELVPKEEPRRLGSVLGALQEAKLLIKRQMNVSPETSSGSSGTRDTDWLKVPVGSPALFRVPTNFHSQAPTQDRFPGSNYDYSSELPNSSHYSRASPSHDIVHSQAPTQKKFPGSDHSSELANSSLYSRAPPSQDLRNLSGTMDSGINRFGSTYSPVTEAEDRISNGHPREDFRFNTSQSLSTSPTYASFPDFFPGTYKQMSFSPAMRSEAGIPPPGSPLYYDNDVRPNLCR